MRAAVGIEVAERPDQVELVRRDLARGWGAARGKGRGLVGAKVRVRVSVG